jgi:3-oxoacyl-[acyl-carrier-protein] synthase II
MPLQPTDVVVTGLGAVTSIGIGVDAFWPSLRDGISGIRPLVERDDEGPKPPANWRELPNAGCWIGGPILGFDAAQFVRPRKALKVMGRELQTAFAASQMAMDQSGLPASIESAVIAKESVATIFGSQMLYGPANELLDAIRHSIDGEGKFDISQFGSAAMRDIMPLWMLKYLPNMAACHVGISIGALGPNNTIVSGDTSATAALIESISTLERGAAKAVVCGSTGSRIDETYLVYRGDTPLASVHREVAQSSRPHSSDADGIVFGEAASASILETREHAIARGVKPLAKVAGYASRFHVPGKNGRGSAEAIQLAIVGALKSASLTAGDIGLVISHGNGDPLRDAAEQAALNHLMPTVPMCLPVALTGHSGAATGGIAVIAAVLSLMHQTIPATPAHGDVLESLRGRCQAAPRPLPKGAVMVLTHNSHGNANAVIFTTA